jgi:uncharacterized membrane protein YgaE (UPF0421/DUF939 family)
MKNKTNCLIIAITLLIFAIIVVFIGWQENVLPVVVTMNIWFAAYFIIDEINKSKS